MIRLVAIKDNKTFSKSKKENYKIGAVISNQKWTNWGKIQTKNNFCTPLYFLTSTEFFLPSQNSDYGINFQTLLLKINVLYRFTCYLVEVMF